MWNMPVDVWRAYFHILDAGGYYEYFGKQAVLDYAIGDYAIYIRFPLVPPFMDIEIDDEEQYRTLQLCRIAETAQAINPVSRIYYEPRTYWEQSYNYATIALPIDVTAAQVADMLYGMQEVIEDRDITAEQILEKLEHSRNSSQYYEYMDGMCTGYETALREGTESGFHNEGAEIIAYATFEDGNEKLITRFRHFTNEGFANAYELLPFAISTLEKNITKYDGIRPKSLEDAVWMVMMLCGSWGWEFAEAEADIPDDAEHKTYDMAKVLHG